MMLYQITGELLALNELLEAVEGDMSRLAEREAEVSLWMDRLGEEQAGKLDAFINLIRQLRMEAAQARMEKEEYAAKEKLRTSRADYLEAVLKRHLEATGQLKVLTASGRVVSVVKNGGSQPVEIKAGTTAADVSADFHKVTVEIDKAAVRAALADGLELTWAELLPRGTHLKVS